MLLRFDKERRSMIFLIFKQIRLCFVKKASAGIHKGRDRLIIRDEIKIHEIQEISLLMDFFDFVL